MKVTPHIFINSIQRRQRIPRWQRQGHTIIGGKGIRWGNRDSLRTLATAVCWIVRGCKIVKVNYMLFIAIWSGPSYMIPSHYKHCRNFFFFIPAGLGHCSLPGAPRNQPASQGLWHFALLPFIWFHDLVGHFILNQVTPVVLLLFWFTLEDEVPLTSLGSHSIEVWY